ncbi:MAG: LutB/LldF family L-lactate oxidation iron-sulfur protein [Chloroflexota bacterium]|nr:LutB/LldF family L-lactate oxidation iron-sulfur protein [Chloroflexota bacterium]
MKLEIDQFDAASKRFLLNQELQGAVMRGTENWNLKRTTAYGEIEDVEAMKQYAATVKEHTLDHLDYYLGLLADKIEERGGHVHFAQDAAQAREAVLTIARGRGSRRVVKSKSMLSEEIELNEALDTAGIRAVESDLGEYILQMEGEHPSHIVGPALHKPKVEVLKLFHRLHGTALDATVDQLTAKAREVIRDEYLSADMGISGVNFAVAETGSVVTVENEGNARLTTSVPRIHVAVMGMEKVIPRIADLGVFLKLLPRAATGQRSTSFVSVITGPKLPEEPEGPEEFHLVIVDNGRSGVLADPEMRTALRCIRCGACLNTCPVYQQVGGHSYGWVYSGPIGSVLNPALLGIEEAKILPFASSLCGACGEVCPVKIPLPQMLVTLRERAVSHGLMATGEAAGMSGFSALMSHPTLYRLANAAARFAPRKDGNLPRTALPMLREWQTSRNFPAPAPKSFHDLWRTGLDREEAPKDDSTHGRPTGEREK